jgi:hypothetical protein
MILLRFSDLLDLLEKEYGIKVTQKEFAKFAKIDSYRLSRIKKSNYQNVNTKLLNQILEGTWKLILDSKREVNEDVFPKLVMTLIDYIPDSDNPVYSYTTKSQPEKLRVIKHYFDLVDKTYRTKIRTGLLRNYNEKISPK